MKLDVKLLPLAALLAAGLSACGGDSDSNGGANTASTSGVVQGSLYEGAKVCIADSKGNATSTCATSAADGSYTLAGTGPVIATIPVGAKEHTTAGDAGTAVASQLVFHAPSGTTNLSLQSELVWQLVQNGASESDAWASVGKQFGNLTPDQLKGKFSALDASVQSSLHTNTQAYVKNVTAAAPDLSKIQNVIFIYAENHSFDNLYGNFPGANGIPSTTAPQIDRDGTTLANLPPIWGGLSAGATVDTAGGATKSTITEAQTIGMANKPFLINSSNFNNTGTAVDDSVVTKDMYHRFYEEQMQIGADGKRASTVAWGDSGAMVMGYYDTSQTKLWSLAKQYTLADNFYQAAFGGSFLNHQYLICACAPEYPNADTDAAKPLQSQVDSGDGKGRTGIQSVALTLDPSSPASSLTQVPKFTASNYITSKVKIDPTTGKATYGATDGTWYGINTMQPPYQPSGNAPAASDTAYLTADRSKGNTLPAQTGKTIGDALDAKSVTWAWYSGAWNKAVAATVGVSTRGTYNTADVNFQMHHQPFNYYTKFDPTTTDGAAYRTAHLKDEDDLTAAITNGTLPQVSFYKPNGPYNQHPGYASVKEGDEKIASIINAVMNSSYKDKVLIVVTYDEFGGQWDHAPVPKGDWVGPGSRIPALIISPFAKKGFVDHTQYDTASILRFLVKWKGLDASTYLPGLAMRDKALVANGGKAMGDFTNALATN
jgi:acid phosphatase